MEDGRESGVTGEMVVDGRESGITEKILEDEKESVDRIYPCARRRADEDKADEIKKVKIGIS